MKLCELIGPQINKRLLASGRGAIVYLCESHLLRSHIDRRLPQAQPDLFYMRKLSTFDIL